MVAFRSIILIALVLFGVNVFGLEDIPKWDENTLGREEATCRHSLSKIKLGIMAGYIIVPCFLSFLFLLLSILVFVYVQRSLMREMDEAVLKAQDVMDAVMVSLIPQSLLEEIGSENRQKKKDQ